MRPTAASAEPAEGLQPLARQLAGELTGPVIAFATIFARIVLLRETDEVIVVVLLVGAVVVGAAFGGRWSALATVGLVTVGLVLTLGSRLGAAAVVPVVVALAVALVTGELRDRASRSEQDAAAARSRLRRLALRDPLTGLLDRRGFDFAIGIEIARESRRGGQFALLLIDVTGISVAREHFGRSVGDTLLQVFGDSLEARIRQSDIAARTADTEFVAILADADVAGAEIVGRQIVATFRDNVRDLVPSDVSVGAEFGAARFPTDGNSSDALIGAAAGAAKRQR
ncbi:MAG TPA: GGDEF domain-containing protein [Verrucomicrobiae bacterium]|nr:GGDEF domain-containing protein [Verrucomicrobiae bacterium]